MEIIEETPSIFTYTKPTFPSDCLFNISPSSIGRFFSMPKVWYIDNMTDVGQTFTGNTGSVTGTICHHIYECVVKGIPVNRDEINDQLDKYMLLNPNPAVDVTQVKADYPLVTAAVVNDYILASKANKVEVEKQIVGKVCNGIYVGGTVDRIEDDCVTDYKNVVTKPADNAPIPFDYKIQLLAYAYILRQLGYEINRIRIVYGVKPTKTLPARCVVVTESIDFMADKLIDDTLKLIAESVLAVRENPELTYLLFKSMDLKQR